LMTFLLRLMISMFHGCFVGNFNHQTSAFACPSSILNMVVTCSNPPPAPHILAPFLICYQLKITCDTGSFQRLVHDLAK
jgi:hypothetical protein